ncbi:MAG TPA: non-ribosomal peptide synthetase [Pseudobacteroides sp.]|nr:non-ribosomal peptide synthetase [Pseudobacteroides sp.]
MYNSLVELLESRVSESKGIVFIKEEGNEKYITYGELYKKASYILYELQNFGIKCGDQVILQIDDDEEFLYSLWACILGGIIPLPITVGNTDEHKMRIFRIWQKLDRPFLITTDEIFSMFERFSNSDEHKNMISLIKKDTLFFNNFSNATMDGKIHYPKADETAMIMFSSGSTGDPKGVIITHNIIIAGEEVLINRYNINSNDVTLHWMPLTHMVGISFSHIFPLLANINQYLMSKSLFIQNPNLWMTKVNQHRATVLMVPTFGMKHFLNCFKPEMAVNWDLSHLKIVSSAGEAISKDVSEKFSDTLAKYGMNKNAMCPIYGITETQVVACGELNHGLTSLNLMRKFLSIGSKVVETDDVNEGIPFVNLGTPPCGCSVRICNDEDICVNENVIGHIQVIASTVTPGYYNDEIETNKVFTKDGWFKTGDVGFISNGNVYITGRAKEIVIVNAINYYLSDIEQSASNLSGIKPGSVIACGLLNNKGLSDEVILFVICAIDPSNFGDLATNIRSTVKNKIGIDVKCIIPLENIPRTAMGKPDRIKLVEMYTNGIFNNVIDSFEWNIANHKDEKLLEDPSNEIEKKLLKIWEKILGSNNVGIYDRFFEIGGQSINVFQMIDEISNEFGITLNPRVIFENPVIKSIAEYIAKKI